MQYEIERSDVIGFLSDISSEDKAQIIRESTDNFKAEIEVADAILDERPEYVEKYSAYRKIQAVSL